MAAAPADTMCLRNRALARRRLGLAESTCVDMFAGFGGSSTYRLLCLVLPCSSPRRTALDQRVRPTHARSAHAPRRSLGRRLLRG